MKKYIPLIAISALLLAWGGSFAYGRLRYGDRDYRNYTENADDGFSYRTVENLTDSFIAYKDKNGEVRLFPLNEDLAEERFFNIDPKDLCGDLTAGEAYTITYDMQFQTGGLAGVHEAWLLKVFDIAPADTDPEKLFANGCAHSRLQIGGGLPGSAFNKDTAFYCYEISGENIMAVKTDKGYTVYGSKFGRREYDELRCLSYERSQGHKVQLTFLCKSGITDEQLKKSFVQSKYTDDPDILYIDSAADITESDIPH